MIFCYDKWRSFNDSYPWHYQFYLSASSTYLRSSLYKAVFYCPQKEWYRVDVAAIEQQMPYELLPFYILQAPEGNGELPFRSEPQIDLSESSHLGYAFQWFIFSLGLGIGYVLYVGKTLKEKDST